MRNRHAQRHLGVFLAVLGLVAILSRFPAVSSGWDTAVVEFRYYAFSIRGDMNSRARHKNALVDLALQGNERALKRYLESVRYVDGANSYWHFNDLILLLRELDDARTAEAFAQLEPGDRERHHYFLSYITDLQTLRPLTYAASEMATADSEFFDPERSFPLFDERQSWP